jgi:hypothetical protein
MSSVGVARRRHRSLFVIVLLIFYFQAINHVIVYLVGV